MRLFVFSFLCLLYSCVLSQSATVYNFATYYIGSPSTTVNNVETIVKLNGRIYLTVDNFSQAEGQYQSIIEVDELGNVLGKISFVSPPAGGVAYPGNAMITNSDGMLLFAFNLRSYGPNPFDGYLVKLTPDLDTLWTRTYDLPPTLAGCPADTFVGNYFTAIRQTPDGGYIIAGNYRLNCQPGTISDRACLLKVDTAGEVEWWQVYPNNNMIFDVEPTVDSGYVFLNANNNGLEVVFTDQYGVITGGGGLR